MAKIGVDIDDTLYSFSDAARDILGNWTGKDADKMRQAAYTVWTDWKSADSICGSENFFEVIKKVHSPAVLSKQVPFEGAVKTIQDLDMAGHQILFITSRDPKTKPDTQQWLDDWDFPVHSKNLICSYDDKIKNLTDCQYIIDDRPKTLVRFVYDFTWKYTHGSENKKKERKGFGLHVTQNLSLTDVPGIYLAPTWSLLRRYLSEKADLLDAE